MAPVPKGGEVALFSDTRFCIQVFSFLPCLCVPGLLIDWLSLQSLWVSANHQHPAAASTSAQSPQRPHSRTWTCNGIFSFWMSSGVRTVGIGVGNVYGPVTESFPSGCPPELGLWELVLGTSMASSGMKSVFQGFVSSMRWSQNLSFRVLKGVILRSHLII